VTQLQAFSNWLDAYFQDISPRKIGVAVSGGGDSMAVLHMAATWAQQRNVKVFAVTVDHGLRDESADEAAFVSAHASRMLVQHETLGWENWTGKGNLQDAARQARKRLIETWAERNGIECVLTGHTADDQAETVLMRLARGSGVDGLSGIQDVSGLWLRPLLTQSRESLRAYLRNQGVDWIEDPSNDDMRFDRVKARQLLQHTKGLGLTQDRLVATAQRMSEAQEVLDLAVRNLAAEAVEQDRGDLLIDRELFETAATDTKLRLLSAALGWVSGETYRPRMLALRDMAKTGAGTLQGCLVARSNTHFRVTREEQAVCDVKCHVAKDWDCRWRLVGPGQEQLEVRVLGDGIAQCLDWRESGLPRQSVRASPSVWSGETLVAAPLARFGSNWTANLIKYRDDFASFLIRR